MEKQRGLDLIDQPNTLTDEFDFSRRKFLGIAAAAGIAVAACSQGEAPPVARSVTKMVPGPEIAPDGPVLKAGLVGCGGRGTGAAGNYLDAGPSLEIAALADVFDALASDRVYKKAWEMDRILELIKNERGKHFDPHLVDIFFENRSEFIERKNKYVEPINNESVTID